MKYRKKPVVIEAFQLKLDSNHREIAKWCNGAWFDMGGQCGIKINTLEGEMVARIGDYIIRGIKGEFYPCKPDIFEQSYDPII